MITVVDYGLGNLGSIVNMLRKFGAPVQISRDPECVGCADKLILPGVGAFDQGMENLNNLNLMGVLNKRVLEDKIPVLGICLGAQLMTRHSEEGVKAGLGWISADTIRFFSKPSETRLKVPHMGWTELTVMKSTPLFELDGEHRFYFVHSYHFVCDHSEDVLATATYGYEFVAAFSKENVYGMQFHPEKSHRFGMETLRRFAKL